MFIVNCVGKRTVPAHFSLLTGLATVIFHSVRLPKLPCECSVAGRPLGVSLSAQPAGSPWQPPPQSGHLLGLEVLESLDHSWNGQHSTFRSLLLLCLILKKKKKNSLVKQTDLFQSADSPESFYRGIQPLGISGPRWKELSRATHKIH